MSNRYRKYNFINFEKKINFESKKPLFFLTDCEEYDEEDDDDGEVHVMNVDVHEGLHHMPDVITSECEQHGKSCLYFYNIVFVFFIWFASI